MNTAGPVEPTKCDEQAAANKALSLRVKYSLGGVVIC